MLSKLCKEAELQFYREYYKRMFDSRTNNMKQLWRNLNNVCSFNYNKRKSNAIAKIINKGRDITNQNQISMHFNNYFSTVGEQLLQQSKK